MKKKLPTSPEELHRRRAQLLEALGKETGRGCVLVGVAVLDDALEQLLRAQMSCDKDVVRNIVDPLFRSPGPFSSFWSRSRAAYVLGYLSPETFHDLETVRELRNQFAHEYGPATFDDPAVRSAVGKLKAADAGLEYAQATADRARAIRKAGEMPPRGTVTPTMERLRWSLAVGWIAIALESATSKYTAMASTGKNLRPFIA